MVKIIIVSHGKYGHTNLLAESVMQGITEVSGTEASMLSCDDLEDSHLELLDSADAIIFGSPTYFGNVSAEFKSFMDSTGRRWLLQPWRNKIAAGFTVSSGPSGDKQSVLNSMCVFAMQHGMIWVGLDGVPKYGTSEDDPKCFNHSGSWLGLMARSRGDKEMARLSVGDVKTANYFGRRIAEITKTFKGV
jgi:NAD(P)H dehydrogenase (quinone)